MMQHLARACIIAGRTAGRPRGGAAGRQVCDRRTTATLRRDTRSGRDGRPATYDLTPVQVVHCYAVTPARAKQIRVLRGWNLFALCERGLCRNLNRHLRRGSSTLDLDDD